ncbi:MAG: biotin synthase BioB [Candidatus Omnitrophota bacterium]
MDITNINDILTMPLGELVLTANRIRRDESGNEIEACSIINAKSGSCSEDCKFCAQSARYKVDIKRYPLVDERAIIKAAKKARANGAKRFGIVTSGRGLSAEEIETIAQAVKGIRENTDILPCASLGSINEKSLSILKESGLIRYHHNLETSERFYPTIVSTHSYGERVRTVKLAKSVGLEVCSGGIFGIGEAWQDRMDLACLLKELKVDGVPLNFFIPIKNKIRRNRFRTPGVGTAPPGCGSDYFSPVDAVRITASFRIILENADIKIVAGRESVLKDFQALLYMAGANGMMIGGYLTKEGRSLDEDLALINHVRELWNER